MGTINEIHSHGNIKKIKFSNKLSWKLIETKIIFPDSNDVLNYMH